MLFRSICSAIAYADLRTKVTGKAHNARRAGHLNEETQYVLDYFDVKAPALLTDLRVQVKDVALRELEGVKGSVSIKTAWAKMKEESIKTLPITRNDKLEGLITIGDIATSYMDVYDSSILSVARTQYRNIASTIDGEIINGNEHSYLLKGKVGIMSSSRKQVAEFIEENDLVILSNRTEAQQLAIDFPAGRRAVPARGAFRPDPRPRAARPGPRPCCRYRPPGPPRSPARRRRA